MEEKYEDSIEMYKETPLYRFIAKWKARHQVQKEKKELRRQNRLLRSHYNVCAFCSDRNDSADNMSANISELLVERIVHIRGTRMLSMLSTIFCKLYRRG